VALDEAQIFQLGHLSADRRMITPVRSASSTTPIGTVTPYARQKWKQSAIQWNARLFDQSIIPTWPVDFIDQIDDRGMQAAQDVRIMCIIHAFYCPEADLRYVNIAH
jgi:hypothetical protein